MWRLEPLGARGPGEGGRSCGWGSGWGPGTRLALLVLGLGLPVPACERPQTRPVPIVVEVALPFVDPAADATTRSPEGITVQALPFDVDAIRDSLAATAASPPVLPDSLRRAERELDVAIERMEAADLRWREHLARMARLADSMARMSRAGAAYADSFALFVELEEEEALLGEAASIRQSEALRLRELLSEDVETYRASVRAWQEAAYAPLDEIVSARSARAAARGRAPRQAPTDANGRARLEVPPGRWWIHARHRAGESLLAWWNVPVDLQAPLTVPLDDGNVHLRQEF